MKTRKIRDRISWLGAIDWDRRLFDSLIPLPDGTSYNAYLIQGSEKIVLVDSVDPTMADAATIVLGTPTVHVGAHPMVAYAAYLANILRPKARFASIIGSFGWSSKAIEQIANLIPNLKVEILSPVLSQGFPKEEHFKALDNLAETILEKHREANII